MAYSAYSDLAASLKPRLAAIENRESFETTRLYDRNGQLLYEFFGAGKRTRVSLDQISTYLISATVAIEDRTFFENRGVDYLGILRTLLTSLQAGEETGGASTITQQLIKNVVLSEEERRYENRYQRKIIEIILAQELSEQYSKKDILELYLNEIYYGNLAYGIEAASNVYFGIPAKDLNLPQAALLAGLPQLPSVYDPFNYLDGGVLKGAPGGWLAQPGVPPADRHAAAEVAAGRRAAADGGRRDYFRPGCAPRSRRRSHLRQPDRAAQCAALRLLCASSAGRRVWSAVRQYGAVGVHNDRPRSPADGAGEGC